MNSDSIGFRIPSMIFFPGSSQTLEFMDQMFPATILGMEVCLGCLSYLHMLFGCQLLPAAGRGNSGTYSFGPDLDVGT